VQAGLHCVTGTGAAAALVHCSVSAAEAVAVLHLQLMHRLQAHYCHVLAACESKHKIRALFRSACDDGECIVYTLLLLLLLLLLQAGRLLVRCCSSCCPS
jgi:hypothetical protein